MKIQTTELKHLTLIVAISRFGNGLFRRRPLMLAVEDVVKSWGLWNEEDNEISRSKGVKSTGLADIDWAISALKNDGLIRMGSDQWQVSQSRHHRGGTRPLPAARLTGGRQEAWSPRNAQPLQLPAAV